jgi:hypothetical protein
MDKERFQQMEKRLNEQAEATRAMNERLNEFIAIMGNQEAARNVTPPPPVSPLIGATTLQVSQPSRVKPGIPSNFDGDRVQGCTFLMSRELYILLTALDFVDKQVHVCWALSYFKGRCVASFAKHILQQELQSGKMYFESWNNFTEESTLMFCLENEATTVLIQLESNHYYQGKWNIEAYINEFKDLIDLSSYTDPIAIVLKFCRGLNSMTQDRITKSGMDRLGYMDFNGWFKAARCLNLNCLMNEAFHLASRCPPTQSTPTMTIYPAPPAHAILISPLTCPHCRDPCSTAHPFMYTSPWHPYGH